MRVFLRADASSEIGAGHVIRSTALLLAFRVRGFETFLVGNVKDLDWLNRFLLDKNISCLSEKQARRLVRPNNDLLIVDSYTIPLNFAFGTEIKWKFVIGIIDAATPKYKCNLYVHSGFNSEWLKTSQIDFLFGDKYLLIHEDSFKNKSGWNQKKVNILVTLGGTNNSFIFEILNSLQQNFQHIQSTTVITHKNNHYKFKYPNVDFKEMNSNFISLLTEIDLIICPASTTAFENLARGIPTGIFQLFNNQFHNYSFLSQNNLAFPLGEVSKSGVLKINTTNLNKLIIDVEARKFISKNSAGLIDYLGPTRVVNEVMIRIDKLI